MKTKVGSLDISYQSHRFIDEVLGAREYDFMSYYPTIIDIGANIGTFSLFMLDHADKIYAIEPAEENIACLKQTIKDNQITKIIPMQMAIGGNSWVQKMVKSGLAGAGGWYLDDEAGDYPVDTRTLKDFMDSQGIEYADLIKIDVEGAEEQIFKSFLFPYDRIGTIIGEYHGSMRDKIKDVLEWMGFKFIDMDNGHFIARKR